MEAGIVTVAADERQQDGGLTTHLEGAVKEPLQNPPSDGAKAKEAKPAAERKRTRNLSEDRRFKLFSGLRKSAAY